MENLQKAATSATIVDYSKQQLGTMGEKIAGDDTMNAWVDEVNDPQEGFPEEENDGSWDIGLYVYELRLK